MRLTERQFRAMQCLMRHGWAYAVADYGPRTLASLARRNLIVRTSDVAGFGLTDDGKQWCFENV